MDYQTAIDRIVNTDRFYKTFSKVFKKTVEMNNNISIGLEELFLLINLKDSGLSNDEIDLSFYNGSNCSYMVAKLQKFGLIDWNRSVDDKRKNSVTITEKGTELLKKIINETTTLLSNTMISDQCNQELDLLIEELAIKRVSINRRAR